MNIIKFRARRVTDGEWVTGSLFKAQGSTRAGDTEGLFSPLLHRCFIIKDADMIINYCVSNGFVMHNSFISVVDETVGQFTGLQDKNETDMYKGDLIRIFYEWSGHIFDAIYEVILDHRGVSFRFRKLTWESYGYNQIPINIHIESNNIHKRWSDYENSVIDFYQDGDCIFTQNIELCGSIHTTPELLT